MVVDPEGLGFIRAKNRPLKHKTELKDVVARSSLGLTSV